MRSSMSFFYKRNIIFWSSNSRNSCRANNIITWTGWMICKYISLIPFWSISQIYIISRASIIIWRRYIIICWYKFRIKSIYYRWNISPCYKFRNTSIIIFMIKIGIIISWEGIWYILVIIWAESFVIHFILFLY